MLPKAIDLVPDLLGRCVFRQIVWFGNRIVKELSATVIEKMSLEADIISLQNIQNRQKKK